MTKTEKPDYLALIAKRAEAGSRRRTKIYVPLDWDVASELDEARQMLGEARLHAQDETVRVKMGDTTIADLTERVAALEQEIREKGMVVIIQALSDTQEVEATAIKDETNPAPYLRRRLGLAFVRAETVHGEPIPAVGAEHWSQILADTAPGELSVWSQKLNRAGQAFDFPMSAK